MCLRAQKRGYRLMITPDAQIMHLGGASATKRVQKLIPLMKAKVTLIRDHWSPVTEPIGRALLLLNAGLRALAERLLGRHEGAWIEVWSRRSEWAAGY
jgi:N-acetylglucosaminyl-diphospho-decaprenol L-rhamnosyltransferase